MKTLPLARHVPTKASAERIEMIDAKTSEPFQSSSNGAMPRNTSPPMMAAITNASTDERPSSAQ